MTPSVFDLISRRLGLDAREAAALVAAGQACIDTSTRPGTAAIGGPVHLLAAYSNVMDRATSDAGERLVKRIARGDGTASTVRLAVALDHADARALGWPTAGAMQMAVARLAVKLTLAGFKVETTEPTKPDTGDPDGDASAAAGVFHLIGPQPHPW